MAADSPKSKWNHWAESINTSIAVRMHPNTTFVLRLFFLWWGNKCLMAEMHQRPHQVEYVGSTDVNSPSDGVRLACESDVQGRIHRFMLSLCNDNLNSSRALPVRSVKRNHVWLFFIRRREASARKTFVYPSSDYDAWKNCWRSVSGEYY